MRMTDKNIFICFPPKKKSAGKVLTHRGWVRHICIIGSSDGFLSIQHQAIIWTKLPYCELDPQEQISDYFLSKYVNFRARELILKCCLQNYADPVYGVATICHQVRCLRWGQPSLFHTAMSLLIWYKMFCMRDISYRLIWMKYINKLSVYAQSGTHRPVNWWIIAVLT